MKRCTTVLFSTMLIIALLLPVTGFAADGRQSIIDASKTNPITVGVVDNSAPVSYWNEDTGRFEGITIDMLNAVSAKTGLCFKYVPVNLSRSADAKNPNEESPQLVVGVISCDNLPEDRGWLLSDGLHADALTVVSRRGADLTGVKSNKKVAVMAYFAKAKLFAQQIMPEYEILEFETPADCFDAVESGEVDAAIYLRSCMYYLLQRPLYDNLEIVPAYSEAVESCVAGFTADAQSLLDIINYGLSLISEQESREIALNYTIMNPYQLTTGDIIHKYRVLIIVIFLLVVSVIASLATVIVIRRKSSKKVKEALITAKMASSAKGNFMSRMSHEIRTPLNAVIGYNTIARNEMTEAKGEEARRQAEMKVMDCLTKSDIASRHLLTIINDVLDMSAIESGKIKMVNDKFDFTGLISSLTAIFYSQAKSKGVEFEVRFETQMDEWIIGDQMRVNQVLTNLLSNAVKFTPDGGTVTLYICPETKEDVTVVRFIVKDSGIGMSPEYLEHLWTPFEQADDSISRRFGGTGLGLSITKTLVDLMGGNIEVISKQGEGSTFNVELTFKRTEQPLERGVYDFSRINALIVDDDTNTCDYIRLLLTRSAVRSTAVTSGEDALTAVAAARDRQDPYTVCIVDWRMPKMDGLETARKIREIAGEHLPIVVITAYDFSEIADKAAEIGVNMFMSKPLFQSSLFNLLANISGSPKPVNTEKISNYNFNGARVLLAEDNAMNMEIAHQILESAGMRVDDTWNGQEAVQTFMRAPEGTYKAILMDVQMPVMDGYTATHKIRDSEHPQAKTIPIIAMTADAFSENVAESLSAGMNDHISKPIDLPTLFETLKKYL